MGDFASPEHLEMIYIDLELMVTWLGVFDCFEQSAVVGYLTVHVNIVTCLGLSASM